MRPDRRVHASGRRGFTVVEILVVLLLLALLIWLVRLGYRALVHHAADGPASVTRAFAARAPAASWHARAVERRAPGPRVEPAAARPGRSSPP